MGSVDIRAAFDHIKSRWPEQKAFILSQTDEGYIRYAPFAEVIGDRMNEQEVWEALHADYIDCPDFPPVQDGPYEITVGRKKKWEER